MVHKKGAKEIRKITAKDLKIENIPEHKQAIYAKREKYAVCDNSGQTKKIENERDMALDFATRVFKHFDQIIKSIVLFGSTAKQTSSSSSDIDIIILVDDVSVKWDLELIAWYREELGKIIGCNPYKKSLHVNTVKLSTWWEDLMRGDPIVVNIIRNADPLIDFGFFTPLKVLLADGKIRSTPESIYTLLQRAPSHLVRTRTSLLAAIDGLYWSMVDSAHAALIAAKVIPPSPEQIHDRLYEAFVEKKLLKPRYADYYRDLHALAKDIVHGKVTEIKGNVVDEWLNKTDEFLGEMARLVKELIEGY